jgi:hypothetical protein
LKNIGVPARRSFNEGGVKPLKDFKELIVKGAKGGFKTKKQDKGHFQELINLVECLKRGILPIPLKDLISATKISFKVAKND